MIKYILSLLFPSKPVVNNVIQFKPKLTNYFTRSELLMGRDKEYPLSPELEENLNKLLKCMNIIREKYGEPMTVSSLYRPGAYNAAAGGAKKSLHMECLAVDFRDVNGKIDKWLEQNQDLLEELNMWQEHPSKTNGWAHVDLGTRPIRSRPNCLKRQFMP